MTSQLDRIRASLQQDIERGVLVPGDAVDERALAAAFGVSRTPVREALLMLAAQGLVSIAPRAGIRVTEPGPEERVAMLEALAEMESVVARLCALRMDATARDALQAECGSTRDAADRGDRIAYERANERFHEALYAGCGNGTIVEQVRRLRLRLAAFRRGVRDQPGRAPSAAREHEAVVDAIRRDDAERAAQAMRDHVLAKGRAYADLLLAPAARRG